MAQWVRLCSVGEAPAEGAVCEQRLGAQEICLARVNGELKALDNLCPHRQGPLGQGWIEGGAVVCPWHSWAFDLTTGKAEFPEGEQVRAFKITVEGDSVMLETE